MPRAPPSSAIANPTNALPLTIAPSAAIFTWDIHQGRRNSTKDIEFVRQQKRIEQMVEKWQAPLWLGDWRLHLSFYREGIPGGPVSGEKNRFPAAECTSDWEYLRAHIKFDVGYLADQDEKELERLVVHELLHCRFAEVRTVSDDFMKHEERSVETMTISLLHCIREAAAGRLKLAERKKK